MQTCEYMYVCMWVHLIIVKLLAMVIATISIYSDSFMCSTMIMKAIVVYVFNRGPRAL